MSNDINHLDANDEGLKAIFGSRFQDETCNKPAEVTKKAKPIQKTVEQSGTEKAMDGKLEPVKVVTSLDKLKACVKWAGIFGGLNALLFYWQQAGLLDSKAAVPSMVVCALLAGLSIGWHAR